MSCLKIVVSRYINNSTQLSFDGLIFKETSRVISGFPVSGCPEITKHSKMNIDGDAQNIIDVKIDRLSFSLQYDSCCARYIGGNSRIELELSCVEINHISILVLDIHCKNDKGILIHNGTIHPMP